MEKLVLLTSSELIELIDDRFNKALTKLNPAPKEDDDDYIDIDEASKLLGLTTNAINIRRRKGQYTKSKRIGSRIYYSKKELMIK